MYYFFYNLFKLTIYGEVKKKENNFLGGGITGTFCCSCIRLIHFTAQTLHLHLSILKFFSVSPSPRTPPSPLSNPSLFLHIISTPCSTPSHNCNYPPKLKVIMHLQNKTTAYMNSVPISLHLVTVTIVSDSLSLSHFY
jgi:hypothetical protein